MVRHAEMTAILERVEELAEAERQYRERVREECGGLGEAGLSEGIDRMGKIRAELDGFLTWAASCPEEMLDEAQQAVELLEQGREAWMIQRLRATGYRVLAHDGEEYGARAVG